VKRIYLTPRATYRTDLRSDTLFGCLCWAIREVFSEADLERLLARFSQGDPPFLISSAFPFRDNDKDRAHFYPRPLMAPALLDTPKNVAEATRQKTFRKTRYVSETAFQKFAEGIWNERDYYQSGEWEKTGPRLIPSDVQHNAIDRLSGGTTPSGALYSLTEYAAPEGGLFFLLDGDTAMVESALGFLHHQGFGGDSSLGKGRFDVSISEMAPLGASEGATGIIALSLYAPKPDELDAVRNGWYDLVMRKGKVGGPFLRVDDFWKRSVPMFVEGATFPLSGSGPFGHNPVVKGPEDGLPFSVQQYGYAFAVPIKIKAA